ATARPRSAAGALGAEIEQAAGGQLLELREEEAAAVAEVGIVALELVAVIAQRQRRLEAPRQRLEAAEMGKPLLVRKPLQSDRGRGALVAVTQDVLREARGRHGVVELGTEGAVVGTGAVFHRWPP